MPKTSEILCISILIGRLSDDEVRHSTDRKKRVKAAVETYKQIVSELSESKEP